MKVNESPGQRGGSVEHERDVTGGSLSPMVHLAIVMCQTGMERGREREREIAMRAKETAARCAVRASDRD